MQNKIELNDVVIKQPDKFAPNWETTYTEDSGRVMSGMASLDPMFTVESFSVEWSWLSPEEAAQILQIIVPTAAKPTFKMRYFSWYHGMWKSGQFYVGQGTLNVKTLEEDFECLESISCNFIGVSPLA